MNRVEYDNTVRELLGNSLAPGVALPADPDLQGFDNLAEGLSLSPSLLELYGKAARDSAETALHVAPRYREHFDGKAIGVAPGYGFGSSAFALAGTKATAKIRLPQAERVTISVVAGGTFSRADKPNLELRIDSAPAQSFVVEAPPSAPAVFTVSADLAAGEHSIELFSSNYINLPADNVTNEVVVSYVDVQSEARVVPATRALVYTCDPVTSGDAAACYERIVTGFAERAFRRPLTDAERQGIVALWRQLRVEEGDDAAVALVVRATLVSPSFLYRPSFSLAEAPDSAGLVPLDDYTLASRLSYFLWSSMPDAALFDAAKSGSLRTDDGLRQAVQRMLADDKARALSRNFAAQWLDARALEHSVKDQAAYPSFDESLRAAMLAEVQQFFGAFLSSELPVQRMLDPGFAFLNDRLAEHYGLPKTGSAELVRVTLPPGARGGILFQGAWLTASSETDRTSPIKRGRFLLERILCRSVPAPPPGIPPFKAPEGNLTVRARLAEHRANPSCAACHDLLDPLGLGLEELDGIGALRQSEAGAPIDTSGALPGDADSGTPDQPFVGAQQLVELLEDDPRFARCLTQKLYSYALGRNADAGDERFFEALAAQQDASTNLPRLLSNLVQTAAFRRQTPEESAQ